LYDSGETPWDLGRPSPHFVSFLQKEGADYPPGKIAVLGAGRGHDAALFAKAGYEAVAFDYAPSAEAEAKALYGDAFRYVQADIFKLDREFHQQFDYLLEHTCFCAIKPKYRSNYVGLAINLLKPGGRLIGVFWEHASSDGPPYNTTEADIREHFEKWFDIEVLEARTPALGRSGTERFAIMQRKPNAV
jgi:SAM-dependent methyltransferase